MITNRRQDSLDDFAGLVGSVDEVGTGGRRHGQPAASHVQLPAPPPRRLRTDPEREATEDCENRTLLPHPTPLCLCELFLQTLNGKQRRTVKTEEFPRPSSTKASYRPCRVATEDCENRRVPTPTPLPLRKLRTDPEREATEDCESRRVLAPPPPSPTHTHTQTHNFPLRPLRTDPKREARDFERERRKGKGRKEGTQDC